MAPNDKFVNQFIEGARMKTFDGSFAVKERSSRRLAHMSVNCVGTLPHVSPVRASYFIHE